MRYLLLFMFFVGVFVLGKRACHSSFLHFGPGVRGEGPVQSDTRDLDYFKGIDSGIAADIEIVRSETPRVEVSAQANIVPLIKTDIRGDILHIDVDGAINISEPIRLKVYAPDLNRLEISGAGNVSVKSAFKGESLTVDISGVTNIDFPQAEYRQVECEVSGSGKFSVGGKADELRADVSGVGAIEAVDLNVIRCKAGVSGSGHIACSVEEDLKADVSGVGSIRYKGNCQVDSHISGAGSVEKM